MSLYPIAEQSELWDNNLLKKSRRAAELRCLDSGDSRGAYRPIIFC